MRAANYSQRVPILAGHILLAVSFPDSIDVPFRLWQILRASMCWQLWLARNECVFSHLPVNPEAVIRKTWHRLGSHLSRKWQQQLGDIRNGCKTREEARASMAFLFGIEGLIWDLEDRKIQVPPRPLTPVRISSPGLLHSYLS